jgi:hypothetical protein
MSRSFDQPNRRWRALYSSLRLMLLQFGEDDPYGSKDFWIVEDYSKSQHKIYITSWELLAQPFLAGIQTILATDYPEFEVYVQIEATNEDGTSPGPGFIVRAHSIEDHLDRRRLPSSLRNIDFTRQYDPTTTTPTA